jgi:Domain of unknown function (DUF4082)
MRGHSRRVFAALAMLAVVALAAPLVLSHGSNASAAASSDLSHRARSSPPPVPALTIFGQAAPNAIASHDRRPVTLGLAFEAQRAGNVVGVRFYQPSSAGGGATTGALYSASGTLLTDAQFDAETSTGWQDVRFARPVPIRPGVIYVAAYFAPHGGYAVSPGGLAQTADHNPLTALGDAVMAQGRYAYGSSQSFPVYSYQADNYWVDVDFLPGGTDCFATPGSCGYPDPAFANVGARSSCSSLPSSGSLTASTAGETIANLNISGSLTVKARNVTVNNVCITANGGGVAGSGQAVVGVGSGATGLTINDSTLGAPNNTSQGIDMGVFNGSGGVVTLNDDYVHDCGECLNTGAWDVNNSYITSDAVLPNTPDGSEHSEDVYFDYNTPSPYATFNHDTLLNPHAETAVIFWDNTLGGACRGGLNVTNSLVAGGGFMIYSCGGNKSTGPGSSETDIENNRFARCVTGPLHYNAGTGGTACQAAGGYGVGAGADSNGYWPRGGYYGSFDIPYCPGVPNQTWANNVWDNNNTSAGC